MEHLSQTRQTSEEIAPPPQGIAPLPDPRHNAQQNSIPLTVNEPQYDPDGSPIIDPATGRQISVNRARTFEEIREDGLQQAIGITATQLATHVDTGLGPVPYSEARTELLEEQIAQAVHNHHLGEQQAQLAVNFHHSADPHARRAAEIAGTHLHDPLMAPAAQETALAIERLAEKIANGTSTLHERQEHGRLNRELKAIRRTSRAPRPSREWWQPVMRRKSGNQKTAEGARRSMERLGASEAHIADMLGTNGREPSATASRNQARLQRRFELEEAIPKNIISRKGQILSVGPNGVYSPRGITLLADRNYVVIDTEPAPAQAFRPSPPGTGNNLAQPGEEGMLHTIYINTAPPGKPQKLIPLPRDDERRGGSTHQTPVNGDIGRGLSSDGRLYYEDGTPINTSAKTTINYPLTGPLPPGSGKVSYGQIPDPANPGRTIRGRIVEVPVISEDSFKKEEDMVVLKPLLTGAEAIQFLLEGGDPNDPLLRECRIRLSDLSQIFMTPGAGLSVVEDQEDREEILGTHLVAHETDGHNYPNDGLRPQYDEREDTLHFRRYRHRGGTAETTRQERQQEMVQLISEKRHQALANGRQEKLLERLRRPLGR